jgi:hypothetical protein
VDDADRSRAARVELQNSLAGKSNKIISQEMAAQMLSRQFGKWGLGPAVEVRGEVIEFSHGGVDEGFEAQWTAFSDGPWRRRDDERRPGRQPGNGNHPVRRARIRLV